MQPNQIPPPSNGSSPSNHGTPVSYPQQPMPQPGSVNPGKTLGIIGFILAFIASLAGLILSIMAVAKSKKAGFSNGLAVAGIIVSVIMLVVQTIATVIVGAWLIGIARECTSTYPHRENYDAYERCFIDKFNSKINGREGSLQTHEGDSTPLNTEVTYAAATLSGQTVAGTCFTFQMAPGYILAPDSLECRVSVYHPNNPDVLSQIVVKGQRNGSKDLDTALAEAEQAGIKPLKTEKRMVGGVESLYMEVYNEYHIKHAIYYIPNLKTQFTHNGAPITSYYIKAPIWNEYTANGLETIVNSFQMQ